jgi:predicted Zn-dependent protease
MAANDLLAGRRALQKLVAVQDDVPENWVELGRLEAKAGSYGDAYHAFTRAYELDRSNPEILRILTQIALRGGDLPAAQRRARELDIVAPGDPWVRIVDGYSALSERRFDDVLAASDAVLANAQNDPIATVLKARGQLGKGLNAEALKLLQEHVRAQPLDTGSWQLLARIYTKAEDWRNVTIAAGHLLRINPADRETGLLMIEAALRSGQQALAKRQSARFLQPTADPALVSAVLDRWADYWSSEQSAVEAMRLARSAHPAQKIVYAAFLNRLGRPHDALALTAPYAGVPIQAGNVEANAVWADALSRQGKVGAAKSRLDAVIAFDSGNATALRSRAELYLRIRQARLAIVDAQKLVTVDPTSSRGRLLLSQCYAASGDTKQAERSLWDGFHDIQASEPLFRAIMKSNAARPEVIEQVKQEYALQVDSKLNRGLL